MEESDRRLPIYSDTSYDMQFRIPLRLHGLDAKESMTKLLQPSRYYEVSVGNMLLKLFAKSPLVISLGHGQGGGSEGVYGRIVADLFLGEGLYDFAVLLASYGAAYPVTTRTPKGSSEMLGHSLYVERQLALRRSVWMANYLTFKGTRLPALVPSRLVRHLKGVQINGLPQHTSSNGDVRLGGGIVISLKEAHLNTYYDVFREPVTPERFSSTALVILATGHPPRVRQDRQNHVTAEHCHQLRQLLRRLFPLTASSAAELAGVTCVCGLYTWRQPNEDDFVDDWHLTNCEFFAELFREEFGDFSQVEHETRVRYLITFNVTLVME